MVTEEDVKRLHLEVAHREVCMRHIQDWDSSRKADVRMARDWSKDHPDDVVRIAARLWLEKNVIFFANKYTGDE